MTPQGGAARQELELQMLCELKHVHHHLVERRETWYTIVRESKYIYFCGDLPAENIFLHLKVKVERT